jgi:hypothetical protein
MRIYRRDRQQPSAQMGQVTHYGGLSEYSYTHARPRAGSTTSYPQRTRDSRPNYQLCRRISADRRIFGTEHRQRAQGGLRQRFSDDTLVRRQGRANSSGDFPSDPGITGFSQAACTARPDTFEDFDRWAVLTLRFGKRKGAAMAVPVYGALAGEIPRCDDQTLRLLSDGYRQCVEVLTRVYSD